MGYYQLKDEGTLETFDIDGLSTKISFGAIARGYNVSQGVGNTATITGAGTFQAPTVSLSFDFRGTSGTAMNAARDTALKWFSKILSSEVYLYVVNFDSSRTTRARIVPMSKSSESYQTLLKTSGSVSIDFQLKTAYFENVIQSTADKTVVGSVLNSTTVTYAGTVPTSPVFQHTFTTTSSIFQVEHYALGAGFRIEDSFIVGDVVVFDCATNTVTVNGQERVRVLTAGGGFKLITGDNVLRIWANSGAFQTQYYGRYL